VLPLIILVYFGVLALSLVGEHGTLAGLLARNDAERLAVWTVLAACVLLRLRRAAALVAAAMLICLPVAALLGVAVASTRAVQAGRHAAALGGPDDGPVQSPS
jgi:hypothetical protein